MPDNLSIGGHGADLEEVLAYTGLVVPSNFLKEGTLPLALEFFVALVAILAAAVLFTNAVEILGGRLDLGAGAVGSVLAAVGTALPETMIPVVAILAAAFAGEGGEAAGEIGIGAILGAPFLLSTLAMFVVGASAFAYRGRRAQGAEIRCREASAGDEFPWCKVPSKEVIVDEKTIARDMGFFLVFFAVAAGAGIVELPLAFRVALAAILISAYALYVRRTLHSGGTLEEVPESLTLWRFPSRPPTWTVVCQTVLALALIVGGAEFFVEAVEGTAEAVALPAGLVALILAPLATELPEKINSVIWVREGKDTLALGNITGAMVFQSTVPVTLGVVFTPWELGALNLFSAALAILSGGFVYAMLRRSAPLHSRHLMVGGAFYLIFLLMAVFYVF
jgi:cation:H+ antiporter